MKKLELLDCTIRDGGYKNNWKFSFDMVSDLYYHLNNSGIDFIEVGFRDSKERWNKEHPAWRKCPEPLLTVLSDPDCKIKISVMVDFGKADENDFVQAKYSAIDMIRVAAHRDKIKEALKLTSKLKDLGYITSIQLMGYPQYTHKQREEVLILLDKHRPDYVYVADSYGSLLPHQIKDLIWPLTTYGNFKVGFHAHNNLQLAFANSLEAIRNNVDIIDCTLCGYGRGAGNLPTELIAAYLSKDISKVLLAIDDYMSSMLNSGNAYYLPSMLSGLCKCHPYYAREIIANCDDSKGSFDLYERLVEIGKKNPVGFDKGLLK